MYDIDIEKQIMFINRYLKAELIIISSAENRERKYRKDTTKNREKRKKIELKL